MYNTHRISGGLAADKNIHASVSKQLQARMKWKVQHVCDHCTSMLHGYMYMYVYCTHSCRLYIDHHMWSHTLHRSPHVVGSNLPPHFEGNSYLFHIPPPHTITPLLPTPSPPPPHATTPLLPIPSPPSSPSQKALRAISAVQAIKHMGGGAHGTSHDSEASGDDLEEAGGEV